MAETVGSAPDNPSWPWSWWPPRGEREPWFANVKRTYDQYGDQEQERQGGRRARDAQYLHQEAKQQEDTRAAKQTAQEDSRAAKQMAQEDIRAAEKAMLDQRLQLNNAITMSYLNQKQALDAMVTQIIADNLQDARVSRSVTYNVQVLKAYEVALAQKVQDAVTAALKEVLGPPRGGFEPQQET